MFVSRRSLPLLLPLLLLSHLPLASPARAAKGGTECVACGIVAGLLLEKSKDPVSVVAHLLPPSATSATSDLGLNPDSLCALVGLCDASCKLFPTQWPVTPPPAPPRDPKNAGDGADTPLDDSVAETVLVAALDSLVHRAQRKPIDNDEDGFFALTSTLAHIFGSNRDANVAASAAAALPLLTDTHPCSHTNITCLINRFLQQHLPISDADGDGFAPTSDRGLRGSHWRGADCSDTVADIYPGRRVSSSSSDASIDHDCNGIFGMDTSSNKSYEELWCSETPRRGLLHIGDSATAHFHLPPEWLSKRGWTLEHVVPDAMDELDQPACAWGTGYRNATTCPYAPHKIVTNNGSIAERLWRRNRCNHRDFQNVGVNGARSTASMALVESAARNASMDHPALVIFSLIGNDVCNGHPGTSHMTPPATFETQVRAQLAALDAKLPAGSAVVIVGLVDGRVLWDNMHARQHPLGATYEEVYGYLNCNQCNPCHGWLNANETLRNATTDWAQSLNSVYQKIVAEASGKNSPFKHFDLGFFDPDWGSLINSYVANGGDAADCIEPSDGFHPSQKGNELFAEQLWNFLESEFPAAIGPVNPHNNAISAKFGDQGGF